MRLSPWLVTEPLRAAGSHPPAPQTRTARDERERDAGDRQAPQLCGGRSRRHCRSSARRGPVRGRRKGEPAARSAWAPRRSLEARVHAKFRAAAAAASGSGQRQAASGSGQRQRRATAASGQRPAASGQRPAASGQRPAAAASGNGSGQRAAARDGRGTSGGSPTASSAESFATRPSTPQRAELRRDAISANSSDRVGRDAPRIVRCGYAPAANTCRERTPLVIARRLPRTRSKRHTTSVC